MARVRSLTHHHLILSFVPTRFLVLTFPQRQQTRTNKRGHGKRFRSPSRRTVFEPSAHRSPATTTTTNFTFAITAGNQIVGPFVHQQAFVRGASQPQPLPLPPSHHYYGPFVSATTANRHPLSQQQAEWPTSMITILSCEHGRMRRDERDITKRDLQKALKFGKKQKTWGNRWKIEYDGIIFITDRYCRREVTAYPAPLAFVPLDPKAVEDHEKAKHILACKPELCHSHYILIIDNSGSMTTHDVTLHRDRQVAAYTTTALELIAEQLIEKTANNSDVVSLIEFSDTARVVFTGEPMSWVLFNKLLARRDGRTYGERQHAKKMELLQCDSNYLPALDAVKELLQSSSGGGISNHDSCALSFLFLSDGAPSDARHFGMPTPADALQHLCRKMAELAVEYQDRLDIAMIGFGNQYQDFSALQAMAQAANDATRITNDHKNRKPIAKFVYCDKMAHSLGVAISSLVTSTTETRKSLLLEPRQQRGSRMPIKRMLQSEENSQIFDDWQHHRILDHRIYDPSVDQFVHCPGLPPGAIATSTGDLHGRKEPLYLALNRRHCGIGVERVAFRCVLADRPHGPLDFRFGRMVAKETTLVDRLGEDMAFHKIFCEMQSLAAHLADEFNNRLRNLLDFNESTTPMISFLPCSILVLEDPMWPDGHRSVLVEKMLDTDRYNWCKWNNNAGAVEGKAIHFPIDVDRELALLRNETLPTIAEEDEVESDQELEQDDDDAKGENGYYRTANEADKPADYLQAFTHFSYLFTNRKLLVCDLQGVYNTDCVPPTFELSDPAIHYRSKERRMVFGRTDKGDKGIQLFFRSHKCSNICRRMQLNSKNKDWQTQWRTRSEIANQMHNMVPLVEEDKMTLLDVQAN